jgi:cell division protein FtsB
MLSAFGAKISNQQSIALSLAILILVSLLFFVIFGDKGVIDLNLLKKEKRLLLEHNRHLGQRNLALSRTIDRLKNDLTYIESVAREELGMIGKDELIFKFKQDESPSD